MMAMETTRTDVAVVGAGPIGLELAVALKRSGIDYVHFDARQIGYTISWFPPQTRFFSSSERIAIAGVPLQTPDQMKATREEYLAYLRGIVDQFDLEVHTYEAVVGIHRNASEFLVTTQPAGRRRRRYRARRIVLCTGDTDRPRRLNIPGEDLPHVSHYLRDPHPYYRKRLLVVGGKNSAVESALRCYHAGAEVSISYRREQFNPKSIKYWLLPEINGLIADGKIAAFFNTVPVEITATSVRLAPWQEEDAGSWGRGDAERVDEKKAIGVGARSGDGTGSEGSSPDNVAVSGSSDLNVPASPRPRVPALAQVEADFLLLQIGYEQDTTLFELAGVELAGPSRAPAHDERTMETNVPGLYVAGTAVAGTQDRFRLFIENCHVHVHRICAALTGSAPPAGVTAEYQAPES